MKIKERFPIFALSFIVFLITLFFTGSFWVTIILLLGILYLIFGGKIHV